jgi:photosystem II stability/assembly factor-like uncharacterized protein
MRTLKISLLIFILPITLFSQTEWEYLGLSGEEIFDIEIDGNGNIYAGVLYGAVYKSTDNGTTWELKNIGLHPEAVGEKFTICNNQIYLATTQGLYKTTDEGDNWFRIAQSIPFTDFDEVQVIPNGYIFTSVFNLGTGGVFRSTDAGVTWEATSFTGFGALDFGINSNGVMLFCDATLSYHGIYRSFDLGITWEMLYPRMGVDALVYLNDGSVLAGSQGNAWGTIPAGIYKTTNNGDTWFNTNTFGDMSMFTDFVLDTNNDIYVSGGGGGLQVGVHISTDSGVSWEYKGLSNVDVVVCLAIDSSGYVYAGTGNDGIFRMPGRTTPVELISFNCIVDNEIVDLFWQTATETNNAGFEVERIQKSEIRGQIWERIEFVEGKGTTTEIQSYTFQDKPEIGKYKYRLKQIDYDGSFEYSQEIEAEVKPYLVFLLEQNYPNPFNPTTTISYTIPVNGTVTLKVFDIIGKEIVTLVNEEKHTGEYEIEFNAIDLPSGIYFYKLQAGQLLETKKMILLK